jgi:hypothetical protein
MYNELTEAIGTHVSGLCVASITNIWHQVLTLESSSDSGVDTLGFSPAYSDTITSFRLVTDESLSPLLDDDSFGAWDNHGGYR